MSPPTTGRPSNAAYVSPIRILSQDTTPAKLEVVESGDLNPSLTYQAFQLNSIFTSKTMWWSPSPSKTVPRSFEPPIRSLLTYFKVFECNVKSNPLSGFVTNQLNDFVWELQVHLATWTIPTSGFAWSYFTNDSQSLRFLITPTSLIRGSVS